MVQSAKPDGGKAIVMGTAKLRLGDRLAQSVEKNGVIRPASLILVGQFRYRHFRAGELIYEETAQNAVTDEGQAHILDVVFNGATASTTWYVGLINDGLTVGETDTYISHAGWTEFTDYDETNRQTWTVTIESDATPRAHTTAASEAQFTISSGGTSVCGGAFLADANEKGAFSTGNTLMAASAFSGGDRTGLQTSDVLKITYEIATNP